MCSSYGKELLRFPPSPVPILPSASLFLSFYGLNLPVFCISSQSQELQRKEEELKQRDAFYKEQFARIEQKVRLCCLLFAVAEY